MTYQATTQQHNLDAIYHHTIATELNNVASALYEHKDDLTAIDLYKHAVTAMMAICPDNNKECPATICKTTLVDKIVFGKEKLYYAMEATKSTTSSTTLRQHQPDFYPTSWSEFAFDHGPQCLWEPLVIDLVSSLSMIDPIIDSDKTKNDSAIILHNMGIIHHKNGSFDIASELFKMAQTILNVSLKPLVLIPVWNNMGHIHYMRGDLNKAMEHFQKALQLGQDSLLQTELCNRKATKINQYMGTILSNIARVYVAKDENEKALKTCMKAFTVRRTLYGSNHVDVVSTWYNLGIIFQKKDEMEEALRMYCEFRNSLLSMSTEEMTLSFKGAMTDLLVLISNIGQTYEEFDMLHEAMECYRQALMLCESYRVDHKVFAMIMYSVGMIHFRMEAYDKALEVIMNSINLLKSCLGSENLTIASMLHNLGIVQKEANKVNEALKSFKESLCVRQLVLGNDNHHVAESLYQIGSMFQEIGEYNKAMAAYEETVRIERKSLGSNHLDVAVTLFSIGQIYDHKGNQERSLEIYQEALAIAQTRNSALEANILYMIGNIHLESGNVSEAITCFSEASRISQRISVTNSHDKNHASVTVYALHVFKIENLPAAGAA